MPKLKEKDNKTSDETVKKVKKTTKTVKKTTTKTKATKKATSSRAKKVEKENVEEKTSKRVKVDPNKKLVIVESPAKSKTIRKILGNDYLIEASYGHIRDFPPKVMGFDEKNNFEPVFQVIPEKKEVVKKLNDLAKRVGKVYLASDPDREGEAIAWHVRQVLDVDDDKVCRIAFNEITPKAVKEAVENCRSIDMDRVHAQQTRQILDRLVGYSISPVLWEKLKNNRLSAGRVQSVALKMICEREKEIEAFVPQEYWTVSSLFEAKKTQFEAALTKYKGKKIEIKNEEEANEILNKLKEKGVEYSVSQVQERETTRKPQAPFITSTLQREASNKLGYGVAKTMQIAQKLYEGLEIDGEPVGLITYMRTDSTRISDDAQSAAKDYILYNLGEKYYPETPNVYSKSKKNTQDAHEAIRPAYIEKTPESLKHLLSNEQYRLYKLIWDRFMSSQMANAKVANLSVEINALDYTFRTSSSKIIFDGFLKLYNDAENEDNDKDNKLPDLKKGDLVNLIKLDSKQHFTQPPSRFSEAALVKALEEYGIGRPSTYAPIITKIQQKGYVEKIDKALTPTILGRTVSDQLDEHFKNIMNYQFTASLETQLDDIAEQKLVWTNVLNDFYHPFLDVVNSAKENMATVLIDSGKVCPNCGKKMLVKTSRFGTQFLGCSGYPECKTMMPLKADETVGQMNEKSDEKCEKCQSEMIIKHGPYGPYLQCTNENCKHRKAILKTIGVKCPKEGCDGDIVVRKSRYGKLFYGCSKYPNCDFVSWYEPVNEFCPKCKSILVKNITKRYNRLKCSNKECDYVRNLDVEDGQI